MLRKLSKRIRNKRDSDFISVDAAIVERDEMQRRAKASKAKTDRPSWDAGDEGLFYTNSRLEALSLEPIIAPTLRRMAPTIMPREALGRVPHPDMSLSMPPRAWVPPAAIESDLVLLSSPAPQIVVTPAEEEVNPFDMVDLDKVPEPAKQPEPPKEVTEVPRRPPLRRKAVSYRTQRDLPLRVQAVRRAHQEQFSRRMAELDPVFTHARRGSAPPGSILPPRAPAPTPYPEIDYLRPQRPHLPEHSVRRAASEAHLGQAPKRSHSHASAAPRRDYYIEAASESWQLPTAPTGMP